MTAQDTKTNSTAVSASTTVQMYLLFGGRCEEALAFYRLALGAEIERMTLFKDSPQPMPAGMLPAGFENKVMHASFRIGQTQILASDGNFAGAGLSGFSLVVTAPTVAEADRVFGLLADGGKVTMPLSKTFFAERWGSLNDRFGVGWQVIVSPEPAK